MVGGGHKLCVEIEMLTPSASTITSRQGRVKTRRDILVFPSFVLGPHCVRSFDKYQIYVSHVLSFRGRYW